MAEEIKNQRTLMETGDLKKIILRYAIPSVIAMIISALYNIVDQIFIGRGVGYIGNAATSIGFPIIVLVQGFALLLGDGATAYYSIKLGEGKRIEGAKIVGNAICLLAVLGIIFGVVSYVFLEKFLWAFGGTESNISYALDYMKIIVPVIPLVIFATGMSSIIRADGSPEYAMISLVVGTVLNCILDPIFIFVFDMGIKGAALATVIGESISFLLVLNYLRRFKNIKLEKEHFKITSKITKKTCILGLPTFITQVAVSLIIIVSNTMLSKYGVSSKYGSDIPLSSMSIVMKVYDILIGIIIGISVGGQPIVGYNYGAKNYKRVKDTYILIIKFTTIISIIGFVLFQFFPDFIIGLFGKNNALYNEFARKSFKIYLMLCMFIGFEIATGIFFQSIGKAGKSLVLTLCKQTIFIIPLMIILPRFLGVEGVLYAGPIAEIMSVIVAFILINMQFKEFKHYEIRGDHDEEKKRSCVVR